LTKIIFVEKRWCDNILETGRSLNSAKMSTLNHSPQPQLGTLSYSYTPYADRYLKLVENAVLGILSSEQAGSCNGGVGGCALGQLNHMILI